MAFILNNQLSRTQNNLMELMVWFLEKCCLKQGGVGQLLRVPGNSATLHIAKEALVISGPLGSSGLFLRFRFA